MAVSPGMTAPIYRSIHISPCLTRELRQASLPAAQRHPQKWPEEVDASPACMRVFASRFSAAMCCATALPHRHLWWRPTFGSDRPLVAANICRRPTSGDGQPLVATNLRPRPTVGGDQPSVATNFWWRPTSGGDQPLVATNLWWRPTLGGDQHSVATNLWWRPTFGGDQHSVATNIRW